jgi:hypothetical protein
MVRKGRESLSQNNRREERSSLDGEDAERFRLASGCCDTLVLATRVLVLRRLILSLFTKVSCLICALSGYI